MVSASYACNSVIVIVTSLLLFMTSPSGKGLIILLPLLCVRAHVLERAFVRACVCVRARARVCVCVCVCA